MPAFVFAFVLLGNGAKAMILFSRKYPLEKDTERKDSKKEKLNKKGRGRKAIIIRQSRFLYKVKSDASNRKYFILDEDDFHRIYQAFLPARAYN